MKTKRILMAVSIMLMVSTAFSQTEFKIDSDIYHLGDTVKTFFRKADVTLRSGGFGKAEFTVSGQTFWLQDYSLETDGEAGTAPDDSVLVVTGVLTTPPIGQKNSFLSTVSTVTVTTPATATKPASSITVLVRDTIIGSSLDPLLSSAYVVANNDPTRVGTKKEIKIDSLVSAKYVKNVLSSDGKIKDEVLVVYTASGSTKSILFLPGVQLTSTLTLSGFKGDSRAIERLIHPKK